MTIVGDGPAKLDLEKLTTNLGLNKNIKFTGFVDRSILSNIYRKHEVFVTASEIETQGLVLLEALACGLPIIGVNVLAIPDVVHNNKTGWLVDRADYKQIAIKMIELIEKPEVIKKMCLLARKEAEGHDISKVVDMLEKNYQKLIL